jgi:glutamate 5-kinase
MGVIPIVNENDTIAVTEIKFGDNDTLSAITAAMVHADYLFLMTDVDCLYDKNPRTNPDAMAIEVVEDIAALQADGILLPPFQVYEVSGVGYGRRDADEIKRTVSSAGSNLGTGGMSTKIVAARLATSAGVTTVITRSSNPGNIVNIVRYLQSQKSSATPTTSTNNTQPGTPQAVIKSITATLDEPLARSTASLKLDGALTPPLHTRFIPSAQPIRDRYFWLLHGLAPHGTIYIDAGAHRALAAKAGLLPVGVVDVEGTFAQQEAVRLVVVDRLPKSAEGGKLFEGPGIEVGRALVNYSAAEISRIKGVRSGEITGLLGYADSEYVALRENISFFNRESRPVTPSPET